MVIHAFPDNEGGRRRRKGDEKQDQCENEVCAWCQDYPFVDAHGVRFLSVDYVFSPTFSSSTAGLEARIQGGAFPTVNWRVLLAIGIYSLNWAFTLLALSIT
jgi:hypothetical protein